MAKLRTRHLFERVRERKIAAENLYALDRWQETQPESDGKVEWDEDDDRPSRRGSHGEQAAA